MLLFKKKFLDQIRRGDKTQTIRLWEHRRMKAGQRSYIPGVGYIAIVSVEPVELALLTDEDAVLDGFASADLLRREIRAIYTASVRKKKTPFKVRFSVYPPKEQEEMALERQRKKGEQKQPQDRVSQTLDKLLQMSTAK
ncbi:MAG: ASCH domain-containing protein [Planctomycetaceae bacterium]|nr:ASCH domain-containing protein [Planctomycetaceae bacterium]